MSYSRLANVIELRSGGITVLRGVFDEMSVRQAREKVLDNRFLFKNTRPTPSSGHLAGFHRFPALEPLHTMLSCNSTIIEFLEFRLNGEGVRSIGLSDITINRSQEWHNDLLRGKFQGYLDDALNWDADGGGVYKVLFYLQDSASLKYIKGSHTKPIPLENDRHAVPATTPKSPRLVLTQEMSLSWTFGARTEALRSPFMRMGNMMKTREY